MVKPAIRLCPLPWKSFEKGNTLYEIVPCGFCGKKVVDRRNVGPDEPPLACPKCAEKYYAGKLDGLDKQ